MFVFYDFVSCFFFVFFFFFTIIFIFTIDVLLYSVTTVWIKVMFKLKSMQDFFLIFNNNVLIFNCWLSVFFYFFVVFKFLNDIWSVVKFWLFFFLYFSNSVFLFSIFQYFILYFCIFQIMFFWISNLAKLKKNVI